VRPDGRVSTTGVMPRGQTHPSTQQPDNAGAGHHLPAVRILTTSISTSSSNDFANVGAVACRAAAPRRCGSSHGERPARQGGDDAGAGPFSRAPSPTSTWPASMPRRCCTARSFRRSWCSATARWLLAGGWLPPLARGGDRRTAAHEALISTLPCAPSSAAQRGIDAYQAVRATRQDQSILAPG
jgi:hypothetical protein